ncbi:MAG: gliding motility lipoprotein GldH [Paludibacteraceae bacterium]
MRRKVRTVLLSSLLAAVLAGCRTDIVYSSFADIAITGWQKDSVYRFDYSIEDTAATYQILIYVRQTEVYPYQNMWLFVGHDGRQDTIEFYLANDRGEWLGNGKSGLIEMPVLYEEAWHYTAGEHSISLQQGMREDALRGIVSAGVEIIKN